MKRSEIALIVVISLVVIIATFTIGNLILGDPAEKVTKIENVLLAIDSSVVEPDSEFFNPYAINPTVEIYIGNCDPGKVWDSVLLACVSATDEPEVEECDEGEVWDDDIMACVEETEDDEESDDDSDKEPEDE